MDCHVSKKTKIIPPDKFKNFVYSYFGGPLFWLYGIPLKSDKKTPMKDAQLVHFPCTCKVRPGSSETLHDYARYQRNLVRCSNDKWMMFDKPVDFHSGVYSKYWKFIRGSDPESKLGKKRPDCFGFDFEQEISKVSDESHKFYKITASGKQVGKYWLSFYPDIKAVGIGSFEIFPEHRRKGYAEKAIKKIVSKYKDKYDLIYCFVDVDNVPAITLYKKIGKVSDKVNDNNQHYVEFYRKS